MADSPTASTSHPRRARPAVWLLRAYQLTLSPLLHALAGGHGGCRFQPSCSQYAIEAFSQYGWIRGTVLAFRRVIRCGPWSTGGYDPVPLPDPGRYPSTQPLSKPEVSSPDNRAACKHAAHPHHG